MTRRVDADRLLVVFSDVEMGAGGALDDFPRSGFLSELLLDYDAPEYDGVAIDLVFNGDTFDLLKTSLDGHWPRRISQDVALAKLDRVVAAHGAFFDGLKRFLNHSGGPRNVHFLVGNHDPEILFASVQHRIRALCGEGGQGSGGRQRIHFPGFALDIGDVHIEHGSQADTMFAVDAQRPVMLHEGEPVLVLPWGSIAIIDVALPLQPALFDLDRLKPRKQVMEHLPEVRDILVGAFWQYWTRDYWRELFSGTGPVKRPSWTMLKEIAYRFNSLDPEVGQADFYQRLVTQDDRYRVVLVGHVHHASVWTWGDRKVITTGCFRDEFMLDRGGRVVGQIPKSWAEVWMRGGRAVRAELRDTEGPPPLPGQVPDSVFDVLPRLRPLLGTVGERAASAAAQADQEAREASVRDED